ncbi:MAG: glycosyltransferase family 2 protein [Eubacteriales bacterium]|nr:glycosyltransferase family 2 protein [Eubacteriales bacterium]
MNYRIDAMSLRDGTLVIEGWAVGEDNNLVDISMVSTDGSPIQCTAVERDRADVEKQFGAPHMCGFTVAVKWDDRDKDGYLVLDDGKTKRKIRVNESKVKQKNSIRTKRTEKLLALCHFETLQVAWDFYKENGLRALWKKAIHKIKKIDEDYDYPEWEVKTRISEETLEAQRNTKFEVSPLISVVIPAYKTPENYLRMLYDSFLKQTYQNFEVVVADGSGDYKGVRKVTEEYSTKYPGRFNLVDLKGNLGIADNTNAGLEAARGDFIALCDHDDELPPDALFNVVEAINAHPEAQFIYTDEDKIDFDGEAVFEPHFKSDFNPELLTSVNYICHLSVIRRDLLKKVGGFRKEFDGAQDYDFFLRCTEEAVRGEVPSEEALKSGRFTSERVIHVPKISYHWRYHKGSTAENPESKLYAFEAGIKAIKAHYERTGVKYKDVLKGVTYGYYHTTFDDIDRKVSIIIPNKDHTDDLDKCIKSVKLLSTHKNIEFIIVENNSTLDETWEYYKEIEKESDIKVVRWEKEFNYSAINNFGATFATGDVLLLLNNDIELIAPDSISEMLNYVMRPEIGIVGARLNYGDDTIQHAGVVIGLGGIAGATFVGLHEKENSYMHRMMCTQDYSAVTAACLMIRKEVFDSVGGLDTDLAVAFNDIDLCMKVRTLGLRVVYDPYSVWHHYESKSRGLEDTPEKVKRFNGEIAVFAKKWGEIVNKGDPYYNPNLTLRKANFALRDLTKEKIGEPYNLELNVEEQLKEVLREKQKRERSF